MDTSLDYYVNAMGRDAVDFTNGEILPDGTVLDGITGGYVVLQPEELIIEHAGSGGGINLVGLGFTDVYGPPGLLGYQAISADFAWTPFSFDFKEDPTSCGTRNIECISAPNIHGVGGGIFNAVNTSDDEICAGADIPDYPPTANFNSSFETFGWFRIFISGLDNFENHVGLLFDNDDAEGGRWMHTKGERTELNPGENCAVAGDEDGDMAADCADPDCDGMMGPNGEICEAIEATCDDGFDNDGDGATDGADTDCDGSESCPSCEGGDQCSDGEDNDGDGNSDCTDGGCDGQTGPNGETCEAGVELTCNDNQDNDGDGTADCDDPDCAIATNCISGDGGGGGGGCSVAATANPSMLNFLLPMIVVGLVIARGLDARNK